MYNIQPMSNNTASTGTNFDHPKRTQPKQNPERETNADSQACSQQWRTQSAQTWNRIEAQPQRQRPPPSDNVLIIASHMILDSSSQSGFDDLHFAQNNVSMIRSDPSMVLNSTRRQATSHTTKGISRALATFHDTNGSFNASVLNCMIRWLPLYKWQSRTEDAHQCAIPHSTAMPGFNSGSHRVALRKTM